MRLASVSKAFNGATALSLVTRQVLSLEDTVGKWRPDLPREWASITLRQLLNHTSGIPRLQQRGRRSSTRCSRHSSSRRHLSSCCRISRSRSRASRPAPSTAYSNSDNVIVGLMIEAATGSSYERALHSQVAEPFGLSHTTLPSDAEKQRPCVRGWQRDATGVPEKRLRALRRRLGVGFGRRGFYTGRGKRVRAPLRRRPRDRFEDTRRAVPIHPGRQLGPRPAPVTTRPGSPSSATRRAAAPSTAIRGTLRATHSSSPQLADGERSATVSINAQLAPEPEHNPVRFAELRAALRTRSLRRAGLSAIEVRREDECAVLGRTRQSID